MPPTCGVGGTASSGEGGSFWRGACGRRCPERPPRRAARQVCPRPVPFGGLLGADTAAETQVLCRRGRRHAKAATEASSPFENAVRARRSARRAGSPLPRVSVFLGRHPCRLWPWARLRGPWAARCPLALLPAPRPGAAWGRSQPSATAASRAQLPRPLLPAPAPFQLALALDMSLPLTAVKHLTPRALRSHFHAAPGARPVTPWGLGPP